MLASVRSCQLNIAFRYDATLHATWHMFSKKTLCFCCACQGVGDCWINGTSLSTNIPSVTPSDALSTSPSTSPTTNPTGVIPVIIPELSDNRFDCGSPAEPANCWITCGVSNHSVYSVLCRNATKCWISCEATKCLHSATIYAQNVSNEVSILARADQCLQNSTIYAPNSGNVGVAVLPVDSDPDKGTVLAMSGMTLYSGYDTTIVISCRTQGSFVAGNDECTDMNIYAENASYFGLTAINEGTNIEDSIVHCPRDSTDAPSCVINVNSSEVHARNLVIDAPEGTPDGVTFIGSDSGHYSNTTLICDAGVSTLKPAEYSFEV